MMKTLQESWREYRDRVYPTDLPADQNAQLHGVWFAASFELLTKFVSEIAAMPDDKAEKALKSLLDEAYVVCRARATAVKSHN